MPAIFLYLLKFSISLAVVYLFYHLALRRLTFYQYNRWYLLAYPVVCLAIPFINVTPWLDETATGTGRMLRYVPVLHEAMPPTTSFWLNAWSITGFALATGSVLLLGRLALQYISLLKIKKQASLVETNGVSLYQIDKNITPFSFANGIYVNMHQHSQEELKEIIRHEYVHVKQRHSIDIMLAELICTLNWYNPFAWLLRRAIRQNLEFIADQQVLQSGIDKKAYQYLLLKVVGVQQYRIVNAFNFSSLKKRIAMMNRLKSAKVHLVKFTFILPLAAVLLLAFRQQLQEQHSPSRHVASFTTDTIPDNAKAPKATIINGEEEEAAFIKRHPKVSRLAWGYAKVRGEKPLKQPATLRTGPVLHVYLTNGSQETYLLGNADDLKRFKDTYGEEPPIAPPPPPPPAPAAPPTPPTMAVSDMPPPPPTPAQWEKAAGKAPQAPKVILTPAAPPPPPPAPPKLPENVSGINVNNKKVTVTLKDGTIEKYDLNNEQDKEAFDKKYGQILPPPPPIPTVSPAADEVTVVGYAKPKKPVAGTAVSPVPTVTAAPTEVTVVGYAKPKKLVAGTAVSPVPTVTAAPTEVTVVGYAKPKKVVAGTAVSPTPTEKVVEGKPLKLSPPKVVAGQQLSPIVTDEKVVVGYAKPKPPKVVERKLVSPAAKEK